MPRRPSTIRIDVLESFDDSKQRLIHRGLVEATGENRHVFSPIRLVLVPESTQRLTFVVYDGAEKAIGQVNLNQRELLSESTEKGVRLTTADGASAASSPSAGASIALKVDEGVGAVISLNKAGVRQVAGRDHANRLAQGQAHEGVSSISTAAYNAPHHADIKFADQPTFQADKPIKGESLEIYVATTSIPALDAISVPAPLVSVHDKQGLMLAHTDVGSSGTNRFSRRLVIPVSGAPYLMRVYDATEDLLDDTHLVGQISAPLPLDVLQNLAQTGGGVSLPLMSRVAGIEKRLRKKDATVQILAVRTTLGDALSPRATTSKPYNQEEFVSELNNGQLIFVDAFGQEHRAQALSSPKADAQLVTLVVSAIGLPKLDALKPSVAAVAALWQLTNGAWVLLGHTEVVPNANPTFTTPLTLALADATAEYKIEVYDAADERISQSELVGSALVTVGSIRALGAEDELDVALRNESTPELQKKLERKYSSLQLSRSGAHSATLAQRALDRQTRIDNKGKPLPKPISSFPAPSPTNAATTAFAASQALPEEAPTPKASPTAEAAGAASSNTATNLSAMGVAEGDESEPQGPTSPQHTAEAHAVATEKIAVADELAAQKRYAEAEAAMKQLQSGPLPKRGDSKATLAHKKAQEELEAARAERDRAQSVANEARANLALKRAARIAEEDRLAAEALALKLANPNMTLWGERKGVSRASSLAQSRDFGNSQIEQIAAARRLAGVSTAPNHEQRGPSQLFLLRASVSGVKGAGAWKPALGVYEFSPSSSSPETGAYLDHTERLDAITAEGAARWSKPLLVERFLNDAQVLRFNLYNMSGDRALPTDLVASANVPFAAINDLAAGHELSLPLYHESNKALNDRLTRQSAQIRVQVVTRGQGNTGSVVDANPTVPHTITGGGDVEKKAYSVVAADHPDEGEKANIDEAAAFDVALGEIAPIKESAGGEAFVVDQTVTHQTIAVAEAADLPTEEAKQAEAPAAVDIPAAAATEEPAAAGEEAEAEASPAAGSEAAVASAAAGGAKKKNKKKGKK